MWFWNVNIYKCTLYYILYVLIWIDVIPRLLCNQLRKQRRWRRWPTDQQNRPEIITRTTSIIIIIIITRAPRGWACYTRHEACLKVELSFRQISQNLTWKCDFDLEQPYGSWAHYLMMMNNYNLCCKVFFLKFLQLMNELLTGQTVL